MKIIIYTQFLAMWVSCLVHVEAQLTVVRIRIIQKICEEEHWKTEQVSKCIGQMVGTEWC